MHLSAWAHCLSHGYRIQSEKRSAIVGCLAGFQQPRHSANYLAVISSEPRCAVAADINSKLSPTTRPTEHTNVCQTLLVPQPAPQKFFDDGPQGAIHLF